VSSRNTGRYFLAVGRQEIDWGKNRGFSDHSALFHGEADVT
jgi:hypothetical protein